MSYVDEANAPGRNLKALPNTSLPSSGKKSDSKVNDDIRNVHTAIISHATKNMAVKRSRSSCSLKEKLEVLKRLDKGESATKLSIEYGVGKATISDWKKNRLKIERFCCASSEKTLEKRQKTTVSSYEKLDQALFLWFTEEKLKGAAVSGPLVKEKALQLNKLLDGEPSFSASSGFLDRWKKRHGITQFAIASDKLSPNNEEAANFIKVFKDLVSAQKYSPQQDSNVDETGLSFKALPSKILASQDEKSVPVLQEKEMNAQIELISQTYAANALGLNFKALVTKSLAQQGEKSAAKLKKDEERSRICSQTELMSHSDTTDAIGPHLKALRGDRPASSLEDDKVNAQDDELISHTAAANALELAVRYVKQHASSTREDVLFMQRWHTIASSSAPSQENCL